MNGGCRDKGRVGGRRGSEWWPVGGGARRKQGEGT